MATGDIPLNDPTANLTNLLGLIKGKSTNSTSSTQSNVSAGGIQAMIKQILEGSQGLAAVSSGQKSAGLYNSTTNQMLVNDLVTRASGEVAKATAGTTTTQKLQQPAMLSGKDLLTGLLVAGGNKILGPSIKGAGKKLGLDSIGDDLASSLGLGGGSAGTAATNAAAGLSTPSFAEGIGFGGLDLSGALGGSALAGGLSGGGDILAGGLGLDAAELGGIGLGTAGAGAALADTGLALAGAEIGGAGLGTIGAAAGAAEIGGTVAAGAGFFDTVLPILFSLFSDKRLKTDIKRVGETKNDIPIYTYKYKNDPLHTHMGVLAQEAKKVTPSAVVKHPSGALMVDYAKLLEND